MSVELTHIRSHASSELLKQFCRSTEFIARFLFVNIPSYLLANSSEIDRSCSIIFAYLAFQVVGFCWAVLVNACFALASRVPQVIITTDVNSLNHTVQLMLAFYVSYASIRVVISYGRVVFGIALESIKDFPEASLLLAKGGRQTLQIAPIIFVPVLLLEIALLISNLLCTDNNGFNSDVDFDFRSHVCRHSGMIFFTSNYPEIRRLIFFSLLVIVLQLWQVFLHQFPRWDMVFRSLSTGNRIIFQLSAFLLTVVSALQLLVLPFSNFASDKETDFVENSVLFGWTLWLFLFTPHVIRVHGKVWSERVSQVGFMSLAAYLRISEMIIIAGIFFGVVATRGFLQAQRDLTFITLLLPAQYCSMYLLFSASLTVGGWFYTVAVPLATGLAWAICYTARYTGKGSMLLVALHLLGKFVQFSGHSGFEEPDSGWQPENDEQLDPAINVTDPTVLSNPHKRPSSTSHEPGIADSANFVRSVGNSQTETSSQTLELMSSLHRSPSPSVSDTSGTFRRSSSHHALIELEGRGGHHSSLVSLGLPQGFGDSWIVRSSKRYWQFILGIARFVTVPDSVMSGILRVFIGIVTVLTLILGMMSIGSYAQHSLQLFPRTIDLRVQADGSLLIDHRVVNVTLYSKYDSMRVSETTTTQSEIGNINPFETCNATQSWCKNTVQNDLVPPYYASCGWRWNKLQLVDFALLSEIAYFDDRGNGYLQSIVVQLFPHLDFIARSSDEILAESGSLQNEIGPKYIELRSEKLGVIVIAVRGTDVGRFHDFVEDMKLYAEPVIFSLLSSVFPTIRYWSHETTSRAIEWLYEFNSFFGLQSESNYYRPLAERVIELSRTSSDSQPRNIIITGHSLGGGLARIVGTLTNQSSVTFSPPGLGFSYRKYSVLRPDGRSEKITSRGALHHNSLAVVTEFDWITQVDHQVGLVQQILCDKYDSAHLNACHLLEGTLCHLLKHCGDQSDRAFQTCDYNFDITAITPALMSHLSTHKWILVPAVAMAIFIGALAIVPELL